MRRIRWLAAAFLAIPPITNEAQTALVGGYLHGQVFLRWQLSNLAPTSIPSYDIYASVSAANNISQMNLVGRVFHDEAIGKRLQNLSPTATLVLPGPNNTFIPLTPSQGAFAWTPHQAGTHFFAVVVNGDTAVTADNRVQITFGYDPVTEPVRPHFQFFGTTTDGYPYDVYVVWVDGRANPEDARPDFPVTASGHRGGVPHVIVVTRPQGGLPASPYPCALVLHGGQGAYQNFLPGEPLRANMSLELSNGIVITPDDNLYYRYGPALTNIVTAWFGYARDFDPFFTGAPQTPAANDVIVNYTSRRVFWFLDWLHTPASPYNVDPERIAVIGHSGGSLGALHLSRQQPERFCAAVGHCFLMNLVEDDGGGVNRFWGSWTDPIDTCLISPVSGQPLVFRDVLRPYNRLSPSQRDFCHTHYYVGKRDEALYALWGPNQRSHLDLTNDSRMGVIVSWDEREHNVEDWEDESPDILDDPAHCDPWPDVGQWIAPVKTVRQSAQYLVDKYRRGQSYPGFFNVDVNPFVMGRQPDPGPGDPCSSEGTPYGTWGGYCDWDTTTLVDQADRWECTLFCANNTIASIDNCPVAAITTDLIPRRTASYLPASGSCVLWTSQNASTNQLLQSAVVSAESDGIVAISGLVVPRDPVRIRLVLGPCIKGDMNCDRTVNPLDVADFVQALLDPAGYIATHSDCNIFNGDMQPDGNVDGGDVQMFVESLF